MTVTWRGLLIGWIIAFSAVVIWAVIALRNESDKTRELTRENKHTLVAVQAQERRNRNALREVCRQTGVIQGLAAATVQLLKFDIDQQAIPQKAVPAYTKALTAFQGYSSILHERPACREVVHP
jgi:hypothetical protein